MFLSSSILSDSSGNSSLIWIILKMFQDEKVHENLHTIMDDLRFRPASIAVNGFERDL